MPAPTYKWDYVTNLYGLGAPIVTTLEASSGLLTKVGTALRINSGQVDTAEATVVLLVGLAAEIIDSAASSADPVRVYLLRPGDVIRGTSDADASSASGFSGKLFDFNSDGSMDFADSTNGCLSVWKTEDAGLTVYVLPTILATFN